MAWCDRRGWAISPDRAVERWGWGRCGCGDVRLGGKNGGGAMADTRERRSVHDPGRVLRDLAVMLADVGSAWRISEPFAIRRMCSVGSRRMRLGGG